MRFLIIQDSKENRRKCTLTPLEGKEGIAFLRLGRPGPARLGKGNEPLAGAAAVELNAGVLLAMDGQPLARADAAFLEEGPLILLDATWARLPRVLECLALDRSRLAVRALPAGIATAYPRKSKLYRDPEGGLASVEALFAATVILGAPRPDFLAHYYWADEFLAANRGLLGPFGVA